MKDTATAAADTATASPSPDDALQAAYARWKKVVEAELKGVPFEKKLVTRTPEGIALQPLYTRSDLAGIPALNTAPGQAPYLRGTRAKGYKDQPWEFAQDLFAPTPAEFNTTLLDALNNGQDSVSLTTSAACPCCGLDIATKADLATALAGVSLAHIPVHIAPSPDATRLAADYLALAADQGIDPAKLTGSIAADPLAHWAASGALPADLEKLYDALAAWTKDAPPPPSTLKTISVNAAPWGHAGATAVQELALALSSATDYLRALLKRGVAIETAAARIRFTLAIGPQFFTEVAKFRALRPLWTRVLTAFGAAPELAAKAAVHATTSWWNKTRLDPNVNMLRVTTEALSAVLGGVDSLNIAPFDELSGKTDTFSRRIARNVHTLLAEEFSFTQVADPAGGSWYVEKLTDELGRKAWTLFQDIEQKGGHAAALRAGYPQDLVAKAAADKLDAIAKRRSGIIGTNLFPNLKETPLAPAACCTKTADAKATACNAAKVDAIKPITFARAASQFEALRAASAAHKQKTGKAPQIFFAKMGPVIQHKMRADFSAGFVATAGFECLMKESFDTPEAAAAAAVKSGAPITVICSTDDTYPALVPPFAKAVKAAAPNTTVMLAGLPADETLVAQFKEAGVDEFLHIRSNVYGLLSALLKKTGAL
ncbi:methylmalonyl-CoA mutase family protein [Geminisphaera colitermitum]|uniref:methylmalonyl-CoA mutase family protein n=1 Tax=Geminisphaera colitermitum TaxID=1148786 RepID=UPI000B496B23|nr:methylmalonyl-CoA mutase family protein [Geminisphaera colitermitum]